MKTGKEMNSGGTSFHGVRVKATPVELMAIASKFETDYYNGNSGDDKTNYDFTFSTDEGEPFTVYDWKEYRPLKEFETVEWHIGAKGRMVSFQGRLELMEEILKLRR